MYLSNKQELGENSTGIQLPRTTWFGWRLRPLPVDPHDADSAVRRKEIGWTIARAA
jgi:hypothetical protein